MELLKFYVIRKVDWLESISFRFTNHSRRVKFARWCFVNAIMGEKILLFGKFSFDSDHFYDSNFWHIRGYQIFKCGEELELLEWWRHFKPEIRATISGLRIQKPYRVIVFVFCAGFFFLGWG